MHAGANGSREALGRRTEAVYDVARGRDDTASLCVCGPGSQPAIKAQQQQERQSSSSSMSCMQLAWPSPGSGGTVY